MDELEEVRERIRRTDREILHLVSRRLSLARKAGKIKEERGLPLRDEVQEEAVRRFALESAKDWGVPPHLARSLLDLLVEEARRVQGRPPRRGRAVVVGGAGAMGRWFVRFLEDRGFEVSIDDPKEPSKGDPQEADLVVVSVPPKVAPHVLSSLSGIRGTIVEITSVKRHLGGAIRDLQRRGDHLLSLHPMWGPSALDLRGRALLHVRWGREPPSELLSDLFSGTGVEILEIPAEEHDALMAWLLTLPQSATLLFARALAEGGERIKRGGSLGGPTYRAHLSIAREVLSQSLDLHEALQNLEEAPQAHRALGNALEDLQEALQRPHGLSEFLERTRQALEEIS